MTTQPLETGYGMIHHTIARTTLQWALDKNGIQTAIYIFGHCSREDITTWKHRPDLCDNSLLKTEITMISFLLHYLRLREPTLHGCSLCCCLVCCKVVDVAKQESWKGKMLTCYCGSSLDMVGFPHHFTRAAHTLSPHPLAAPLNAWNSNIGHVTLRAHMPWR